MGNPDAKTPNIDKLASQGILFRNTFANTPVCCPARAILMTEKDALKCENFADERCWFLPVQARIDDALVTLIEGKLRGHQAA